MLLSFHPIIEGDAHRLCAGRDPDPEDLAAMRTATAIVLPLGCRESLYRAARKACPRVFPNYEARFAYPGKTGQVRLFRDQGVPHPASLLFADMQDFRQRYPAPDRLPIAPPLVVKRDWGGEGRGVYPAPDTATLRDTLQRLEATAGEHQRAFLIQRFIPTRPRVLRVVVVGRRLRTYWRVMAPTDGPFAKAGLALGGRLDFNSDPHLMQAAESAVAQLCRATGINLAAFDLLFTRDAGIAPPEQPIFLEINYFFGRQGLGGSEALYTLMREAIRDWQARNEPEPSA